MEIQSPFPDMYTQDELVEYDKEVLHNVPQIMVALNEDVHQFQGLIHMKVEVEDEVDKLKVSFNDTLKNK